MASNSKAFVSVSVSVPATLTNGECSQNMALSGSFPIRAPLTLDDSEFDVSSDDATLYETASHSDPSVSEADSEAHYASEEEEEEECFELDERAPLVQLPAIPLRVTPFAHLSTYDDDDGDDEDDNEMLSVVRAPKTSMFTHSLPVPVSQSLLASDLTFSDDTGSDVSIEAENDIPVPHGVGIRVACDGYSTATDSDVMSQYSQDSLDAEQFGNVRVALNELENDDMMKLHGLDGNDAIRVDLIETDASVMQRKLEVEETSETTDMVEATSNTGLLESNAEDCNDTMTPEQNSIVHYLGEQNPQTCGITDKPLLSDDSLAENIECNSTTTQETAANGSSQGVASHQGSDNEKLVSITESLVDSNTELHDSSSAGFESNGDACGGNTVQSVESSEFFDPILLQECAYLEKDMSETVLGVIQEDELFCDYRSHENVEALNLGVTVEKEAAIEVDTVSQESKRDGSALDEDVERLMPVGLEQFREQISALSILLGLKGPGKNSQEEQTIRSSHGNMNIPKDDLISQLIYVDSGGESDCNSVTVTYGDESSVFFLKGPASFSSLPRCDAQAGFQNTVENEKAKIQKIHTISVKFLRLVQRINFSLEDSLVSKVLCRLVADIGRRSNQEFVIRSAKMSAKKLEEVCQDDLDFCLNILVLGKSGVGKSATINSIFGEVKVMTNAFEPGTTSVQEVSGTIDGVKIRILDTPGLRSPMKEQAFNRKMLSSVKRHMKKFPPDVILYVDRVDIQTRDLSNLPILRAITSSLGPSVWQHAILALTHAASTPLDGPSGSPLSYEVFVAQKSYLVQQSITKAIGDLCQLSPGFMCPVSLVENHPLCGKNTFGDSVLPSGLRWRSQLLALCFSLKTLSQVSPVSGTHTFFDHWKQFFFLDQDDSRPLCHLCSCLLQSPAHLKFSATWN